MIKPLEADKNEIKFTPMKSLGHELGILFGFLVACLLTMAIYIYFWDAADRREKARDELRRVEVEKRNARFRRQGLYEKMTDREILGPRNVVELPVDQGTGAHMGITGMSVLD
ncbi:uncharacterized protein ACLA_075150 [Aspergillus clavatus NRRL 1]|uniref:Uncharacterized protein n=1 Tax=Aspergillus clavatus (strain ATCC 1007 / CBS 513.65 / DSM 816 / NCTC 3887 / NRRL 1 / QM 1276 / 107) TaxID=344612 RepID=A1C7V6_ASPCL|nr:uncharacterized protein ACLA_075150 [Aspergillus clavatus NRRL 1]EAW14477.1 conserved hypothetical protein [Aspergillus clavatus NRRL 1]